MGEYYRDFSRKQWRLDSASMYLDAALKESKQNLDLISHPNLYEIMEKSICGGFVTVVKRQARANNIHVPGYKAHLLNLLLFLLDFNGLYAGIQEFHMPIGNFKLLSPHKQSEFKTKLLNRSYTFKEKGYWIEFDYYIPAEVAHKTDELPLSLYVADNIRGSDYMRGLLNGKPAPKGAKLVATHLPMKKASAHYKWLDSLIGKGLVVDKVHCVWNITQEKFLKSYVEKNMEKRVSIENEFFKAILKLASNAPCGKFLEQKRKRNVRASFVTTAQKLRKHARCGFLNSVEILEIRNVLLRGMSNRFC